MRNYERPKYPDYEKRARYANEWCSKVTGSESPVTPEEPVTPVNPGKKKYHVVKAGDNLTKIAKSMGQQCKPLFP